MVFVLFLKINMYIVITSVTYIINMKEIKNHIHSNIRLTLDFRLTSSIQGKSNVSVYFVKKMTLRYFFQSMQLVKMSYKKDKQH